MSGFEHRPLFDVSFQVADDFGGVRCRVANSGGVEAEVAHGLVEIDVVAVLEVEGARVEGAGEGAGAEIGGGEADAFLFGEADDVDREGEAFAGELFDDGEAEHDSQNSVVFAGVGDGVEMGADEEDGGVGRHAGVMADEVADGVDADGHAGGGHPDGELVVDSAHRVAEECSRDGAGGFGEGGEKVAALKCVLTHKRILFDNRGVRILRWRGLGSQVAVITRNRERVKATDVRSGAHG